MWSNSGLFSCLQKWKSCLGFTSRKMLSEMGLLGMMTVINSHTCLFCKNTFVLCQASCFAGWHIWHGSPWILLVLRLLLGCFLEVKCKVIVHFGLDNVIHLSGTSCRVIPGHRPSERVRMWKRCAGFVATVIDYCTPVLMTWLIRFCNIFRWFRGQLWRCLHVQCYVSVLLAFCNCFIGSLLSKILTIKMLLLFCNPLCGFVPSYLMVVPVPDFATLLFLWQGATENRGFKINVHNLHQPSGIFCWP